MAQLYAVRQSHEMSRITIVAFSWVTDSTSDLAKVIRHVKDGCAACSRTMFEVIEQGSHKARTTRINAQDNKKSLSTYTFAPGSPRSLRVSLIMHLISVMDSVMASAFSRKFSVSSRCLSTDSSRPFMSESCESLQARRSIRRSKSGAATISLTALVADHDIGICKPQHEMRIKATSYHHLQDLNTPSTTQTPH